MSNEDFDDDEITDVTPALSMRERFIAETNEFLKQYMKIKAVPDASKPIDVDAMLAEYDEAIAKDG
jgi:hypothetical protein